MRTLIRLTSDSTTKQASPNTNFQNRAQHELRGDAGNVSRVYLHVPLPDLTDDTDTLSALLDLTLKGAGWAGGPHTIRARRITSRWQEKTLTHNAAPTVHAVDADSVTLAVNAGVDGAHVQINLAPIIAQAIAGLPYFGIRLEVDTNGVKLLHSSEAALTTQRPVVDLEVNRPPAPPVIQRPAGDRAVSVALPEIAWLFGDPDDEDAQTEKRVQVATAPDRNADGTFVAGNVVHDSGWIVDASPRYNLAATAMAAPADGARRYAQVKARDTHGKESGWSEIESWRRVTKGVLTITAPAAGNHDDATPVITHNLTVRAHSAVEYAVYEGAGTSGKRVYHRNKAPQVAAAGVAVSFELPAEVITKKAFDYTIEVKVWDTENREDMPGDRPYVVATRTIAYAQNGAPGEPTNLVITQRANGPAIIIEFQRAAMPDFFALWRDGVKVLPAIDPASIRVGATNVYRLVYFGAKPGVQHSYEVSALTTGVGQPLVESDNNPVANFTSTLAGVWYVVPEDDLEVAILGPSDVDMVIAESSELHHRIGAQASVRFVDSLGGYEGRVLGQIKHGHGQTADEWKRRLLALKDLRNRKETRLVYRKHNYPVELGPLGGPKPHPQLDRYFVEIETQQVGDFDLKAVT